MRILWPEAGVHESSESRCSSLIVGPAAVNPSRSAADRAPAERTLTGAAVPPIIAARCDVAIRALRAIVRGRVQGVGFRAFVLREARALGLRGFTRNLFDGGVEVVAVGEDADVQRLVQRLHVGPPLSRVEAVDRTPIDPPPDTPEFEVRG